MKFSNMKIGARLIWGFLIVSIIFTAVGLVGLFNLNQTTKEYQNMYLQETQPSEMLAQVSQLYQRTRVIIRDIILLENMDDKQSEVENIQSKDNSISELLSGMKNSIREDDQELLLNIESSMQKYTPYKQKVIEFALAGQSPEAYGYLESDEVDTAAMAVQDSIDALSTKLASDSEVKYQANNQMARTAQILSIILIAAAFGVAVALSLLIARGISRPIKKVSDAAEMLAAGNTDIELGIKTKDEIGILAKSFEIMVGSIKKLIVDVNMLSEAAVAGEFDARADAEKHQGDYRKIVEGVNGTLDTVVEKVFWYESLLDSIPFPISVTDMNMNWTFINKPVEQMLKIERGDVLGKQCSNWNANICNTENCGIARLRSGQLQTEFLQNNMNFQVDTTYIYDTKGEKAGHIELVQDITAKAHSAEYSASEVAKLANNLKLLKEGNLKLEFNVGEGDQYTQQEKENFEEINRNFKEAVTTIAGYVDELSYVLGRFADRDLTQEITSEYRGDFITLKESINHIMQVMNELLSEINTAADQVATGSNQVSQGNQAISQGATEQAASIEELTASLTQVAEQTHENAENSKKSNEMVMEAKNAAVEGNAQMKEMLKSMEEINESSENISKIIKVIDDIAFQTNILALNAAVEAARAGMHGKGFAVVAEEVRNLAARSANAARETTELIEGSIKIVGTGTRIAQSTAQALGKIVDGVNKTVELGEGIAVASAEQAAGIAQINQGVEQMSQVVQTNSATAQEGAAASEELSGQAELLKEKISSFKLKKGQAASLKKANTYHEISIPDKGSLNRNDKY